MNYQSSDDSASEKFGLKTWLRKRSPFTWIPLAAGAIAAVSSALASLDDIGDFFGWQHRSQYTEYVGSLLRDLDRREDGLQAKKWTIDKFLIVAEDEKGSRPILSARLADFIRERSRLGTDLSVVWYELPKDAAPDTCGDEIQYAVQVLGKTPLVRSWAKDPRRLMLRDSVLPEIYLEDLSYERVDFSDAIMFQANLNGASFIRCVMSGVVLTHSRGHRAHFDNTSLHKAHFNSTEFREATFRKAELAEADFSGADLTGADFSGATEFDQAIWTGARVDRIVASQSLINWVLMNGAIKD